MFSKMFVHKSTVYDTRLFDIFLLDKTKVVDLGRNLPVVSVALLRFFLPDTVGNKKTGLERGRSVPSAMGISSWFVRPLAGVAIDFSYDNCKPYAADDFVHITSDTGGVVEGQHKLVFWVDDENARMVKGRSLLIEPASIIP
jgi:hypothetical protein